jgi:hypothetical protein
MVDPMQVYKEYLKDGKEIEVELKKVSKQEL